MTLVSRVVSRVVRTVRRSLLHSRAATAVNSLPDVHPKFGRFYKNACRTIYEGCGIAGMRESYLLGSVVGALQAKACDVSRVVLIEFGVAHGEGFRVLLDVAGLIASHFDLEVEVVGFDNRDGLPPPIDYRDHPEIWSELQFAMGPAYETLDKEASRRGGRLVIGDVSQTLPEYRFQDKDTGPQVIAFCSVDVDYYSSTLPITRWLGMIPVDRLLPATPIYFDDTRRNWTYSDWAGESLAISEFNHDHADRKIELRQGDLNLYALHAFDHPVRRGAKKASVPTELFVDDLAAYWWR